MASRKPRLHFNERMILDYLNHTAGRLRSAHTELRAKIETFVERAGETEPVFKPGFKFGCIEHNDAIHSAGRIVDWLFDMTEAVEGLNELCPAAKTVIAAYEEDFERWRRMRHDLRHSFERLYRDKHPRGNDAFINGCQGYRAAHFDLARDTFFTGRA